ncbi:hypothetical protein CEP51_004568 [Fusarium floridanum]|uniref:Uncharacterized protein n=1 Tax=Fusarium floridanum TaxID=1325733 RepID=A0A428S0J5_9HYPO|nr:hypothetical protein CEP51_004568 [Fusarium floridanum]
MKVHKSGSGLNLLESVGEFEIHRWLGTAATLHQQLEAKLASVETTSNSADAIISEARQSLQSKLTGTNVVSTIGSGLSVIGGFVTFSPFGLVAVGLMALGTLKSAASSLVKKLIFEKGAATAFGDASNKYSISSGELQTLNEDIEKAKEQLLISLALFLEALQIEAPSIPPDINKDESEVTIARLPGTANFRLQCAFVPFGGQEVYNVSGSSSDKRGGSWVGYWTWWFAKTMSRQCLTRRCYIKLGSTKGFIDHHTKLIVGGHLEPEDNTSDKNWYILTICQAHNAPHGVFDRNFGGKSMITYGRAWAVRIPRSRRRR